MEYVRLDGLEKSKYDALMALLDGIGGEAKEEAHEADPDLAALAAKKEELLALADKKTEILALAEKKTALLALAAKKTDLLNLLKGGNANE